MATGNISITVDGVGQMADTLNAVAAQLATLTMKVDQYMTSAADQAAAISSSLENIRTGFASFQQSTTDAQTASAAALADLQTKLDAALADQSAAVQQAVTEAVAAANTEISNQFAGVVAEAQSVADSVPDAPAAPDQPPVDNPPVDQPPVDQPPVDTPPADNPTPDNPTGDVNV